MKQSSEINARLVALKIIHKVNKEGAYANILLAKEISSNVLIDQDRRFITELVYGTIKATNTLDWLLSKYIDRPLKKIAPIILDILRLGMYQLTYLSKVPASAVVNESVKLAKKFGHQGTVKFVNAVLRNASKNQDNITYPSMDAEPVKYLSLKYYHPEWLVERWLDKLGFSECEELCAINNSSPELTLRTNTLKISREDLIELLSKEGIETVPSILTPEGIIVKQQNRSLASLAALKEGLFQIQDESSMLVGHILDPKPGEFIIDACAAPGGKSTHIATLMKNEGKVLSCDIYDHKINLIKENAARLGISIIESINFDATKLNTKYKNKADKVLVDAPCSGLGVLRRKPDSRWRKSESMLSELPKLQIEILKSAADCVKPGGVLVYSTCTTEPEENINVVNEFLATRNDYSLDDVTKYLPCPNDAQEKTIQFWPQRDKIDGFFISRMFRK